MRTRRSLLSLLLSLVLAGGLVPLFQAQSSAHVASEYEDAPASFARIAQCGGATVFIWRAKRLMFCTGDGRVYTSEPGALSWEQDQVEDRQYAIDTEDDLAENACGNFWNPAIVKRKVARGSGQDPWVMVYQSNFRTVDQEGNTGPCRQKKRCLYVATAQKAMGPYTTSTETNGRLVCDAYAPQWFKSSKGLYLLAKTHGKKTAGGATIGKTGIAYRKMGAGLLRFERGSSWVPVDISSTRTWEDARCSGADERPHKNCPIEGPAFLRLPSGYWVMFYSAGDWRSDSYGMGYIVCGNKAMPTRTCTKPRKNQLVSRVGRSFSIGAGMGVATMPDANGKVKIQLVAAGFFGDVEGSGCTIECNADFKHKYARIFQLRNNIYRGFPDDLDVKLLQ